MIFSSPSLFSRVRSAYFCGALIAVISAPQVLALAPQTLDLEVAEDGSVSWQGEAGYVYFLQWSLDLVTWSYAPETFAGLPAYASQSLASTERFFCRVRAVYAPEVDPNSEDFDDDGISNLAELTFTINGQLAQLDPLNADTDGDGFSDGMELQLGTDPSAQDHAATWTGAEAIVLTPAQ